MTRSKDHSAGKVMKATLGPPTAIRVDQPPGQEASKEELQQRVDAARESISQTVGEIRETVEGQYESVKATVSGILDWREGFGREPLVWSVGALSAGFALGYTFGVGQRRSRRGAASPALADFAEALIDELRAAGDRLPLATLDPTDARAVRFRCVAASGRNRWPEEAGTPRGAEAASIATTSSENTARIADCRAPWTPTWETAPGRGRRRKASHDRDSPQPPTSCVESADRPATDSCRRSRGLASSSDCPSLERHGSVDSPVRRCTTGRPPWSCTPPGTAGNPPAGCSAVAQVPLHPLAPPGRAGRSASSACRRSASTGFVRCRWNPAVMARALSSSRP